jgi:hypothetical protein
VSPPRWAVGAILAVIAVATLGSLVSSGPPPDGWVTTSTARVTTTSTTQAPTTTTTPSTTSTTQAPTTTTIPPTTTSTVPRIFSDIPVGSDLYEPTRWAKERGLIVGTGGGAFGFGRAITRMEAKLILWRFGWMTSPYWQGCNCLLTTRELADRHPGWNLQLKVGPYHLSRGQFITALYQAHEWDGRQKQPIGYSSGLTGFGGATPNTEAVWRLVKYRFPAANFWGARAARGTASEHPLGRALDINGSPQLMVEINRYLLDHARLYGVKYTILNQTIYFPNGTSRRMANRGNRTANHYDHVHVSFVR